MPMLGKPATVDRHDPVFSSFFFPMRSSGEGKADIAHIDLCTEYTAYRQPYIYHRIIVRRINCVYNS